MINLSKDLAPVNLVENVNLDERTGSEGRTVLSFEHGSALSLHRARSQSDRGRNTTPTCQESKQQLGSLRAAERSVSISENSGE